MSRDLNIVLRAIQKDRRARAMARAVARRRFEEDTDIQNLFLPLINEVDGLGKATAGEIAWELFVLMALSEPHPLASLLR